MTEEKKLARLIDKKFFNLEEKPRKKTGRSSNKIVDKKVVNKILSMKNFLTQWETKEEN